MSKIKDYALGELITIPLSGREILFLRLFLQKTQGVQLGDIMFTGKIIDRLSAIITRCLQSMAEAKDIFQTEFPRWQTVFIYNTLLEIPRNHIEYDMGVEIIIKIDKYAIKTLRTEDFEKPEEEFLRSIIRGRKIEEKIVN